MRPVAILGTGPAGLLAAHAVGLTGLPIAVFGQGQKSRIGGAQFLHKPIPELTNPEPDFHITYRVEGTADTYMKKVYGTITPPFVSFSGVHDGKVQDAWSLEKMYDHLWENLEGNINIATITPDWIRNNQDNFRAIVSTIPAPALCDQGHIFTSITINIASECILNSAQENTVYYDGNADRSWYRCSLINGVGGTEWGEGVGGKRKPPMKTFPVVKPVRQFCTCFPEVIRVGRYGAWKKGELAHEGFYKTLLEMNERGVIHIGPRQSADPVQMKLL